RSSSPDETVENWLVRNGQTSRLREMLWDPLALAALNQSPAEAAAPMFAAVLARMFGSDSRAAAIALPAAPLHLMYAEPARAYIESHGGAIEAGVAAKVQPLGDHAFSIAGDGRHWTASAVLSAVPWFAFAELFEIVPPPLVPIADRAGR